MKELWRKRLFTSIARAVIGEIGDKIVNFAKLDASVSIFRWSLPKKTNWQDKSRSRWWILEKTKVGCPKADLFINRDIEDIQREHSTWLIWEGQITCQLQRKLSQSQSVTSLPRSENANQTKLKVQIVICLKYHQSNQNLKWLISNLQCLLTKQFYLGQQCRGDLAKTASVLDRSCSAFLYSYFRFLEKRDLQTKHSLNMFWPMWRLFSWPIPWMFMFIFLPVLPTEKNARYEVT